MQVLNPSATVAYSGVLRNTYQIASSEGFFSLWRGMSSVVVGAGKVWFCCEYTLFANKIQPGPAHAVYFATYEAVKHAMGGNQAGVHHPLAAGMPRYKDFTLFQFNGIWSSYSLATSGAAATIASDAFMNPFDGKIGDAVLRGSSTH